MSFIPKLLIVTDSESQWVSMSVIQILPLDVANSHIGHKLKNRASDQSILRMQMRVIKLLKITSCHSKGRKNIEMSLWQIFTLWFLCFYSF